MLLTHTLPPAACRPAQGWDRELDKPDNTKGDVSSSRLSGVWVARDAPAQQQGQGPAAAGQVSAARHARCMLCCAAGARCATTPAADPTAPGPTCALPRPALCAAPPQDGPQLQVVDLHRIFEGLDGVQGSPFLAQMDR